MIKTHENGTQYEHSLDHAVEFFSKAGSCFSKKQSFYQGEETALSLFQKTWIVNKELSMKLLFWLRDCRGGAGNRSGFRECIKWIADRDPKWIQANIHQIPAYGRWDDLRSLFGTKVEFDAAKLWAKALEQKDVLAAKWCDRKDSSVKHILNMKVADFRKYLASIRKSHIVEHKMCSKQWNEIEYSKVPSVAMARYTKVFGRNDTERFNKYKELLKENKTTVKASVLFPHDCVRTAKNGDTEIADAQFDALPNFLTTNERIIVICDTSGSMCASVSGSIEAVDISQGMALYCSAKISKDNPFYKKFISFSNEGRFKNWNNIKFSEAIYNTEIFDGAIGTTRIDNALMLILDTAKFFNLTKESMPTCLLIVSDMQFHEGVDGSGTEVEKCLEQYKLAGYDLPKIAYWNVVGYAGQPATVDTLNAAMVSGFSPSILTAIFSGKDFSPTGVMLRAIEKYKIVVPE